MHSRQWTAAFIALALLAAPATARQQQPLPQVQEQARKAATRAQEPQALAAMLDAMERKYGFRPAYERLMLRDGMMELRGVRLSAPDAAMALRAESIELSAPQADDGGLYTVATITLRDLVLQEPESAQGFRIRIPVMELRDVSLLPRAAARGPREELAAGTFLVGEASVPDIYFEPGDKPALVLRGLHSTWSGDRRTGMGRGQVDFGRLALPVSLLTKESGDDTLANLGYDTLVLAASTTFSGDWGEDGRIHSSFSFRFGADNAGYQEIAVTDLAIPESFVRRLYTMQEQGRLEEEMKSPDAALQALSGLTLRGMRIAWIDRSLARRLVDYMAKKEGLSREAWIANISAFPQVFLMQMGLPQLAASASEELRRFLSDPKSLTISFQARAPMSIDSLMTLMADPSGLVESLNLKIEANTEE